MATISYITCSDVKSENVIMYGLWEVFVIIYGLWSVFENISDFVASAVPADGLVPSGAKTSASSGTAKFRSSILDKHLEFYYFMMPVCKKVSMLKDGIVFCPAGIQSAGDSVPETPWVWILHSAEEDHLSPFDLKIACLCQSIEINNNKHVYHQSQVQKPTGSGVKWAEFSLFIGTGYWIKVLNLLMFVVQ